MIGRTPTRQRIIEKDDLYNRDHSVSGNVGTFVDGKVSADISRAK